MKKGRNLQGFGIKTVEFTEFAWIANFPLLKFEKEI